MSIKTTPYDKTIFPAHVTSKFPNFLKLLFFVELWERFSYYGMRALLVLFLVNHLGFADPKAYAIYSLFAALGYAGPVLGGWLADKFMGFRNMVFVGASILVIGHSLMFLEIIHPDLIYLGLGAIAIGTGLFKGSITNLLGTCYAPDDPERDRGFTLFYVSVNLGSTLAGVACGFVAKAYGWHYGFGLAAIGMISGLILFTVFQKRVLGDRGLPTDPEFMQKKIFLGLKPFSVVMLGGLTLAALASFMLQHSDLFAQMLTITATLVFLYVAKLTYECDSEQRRNMITLGILTFFFLSFFALEMQMGSLMNLFTERNVDKVIFGYEVPAAISQSISPFAIILFGPFAAALFVKMGTKWEIRRFGLGLFFMITCFLTLYYGCTQADENGQVSYFYLFSAISLLGIGEVFLAPLLVSLFTVMTPRHLRGFMVGVMYLSLAFSNLFGIVISKFMSIDLQDGKKVDTLASLSIYQDGFLQIMYANIAVLALYVVLYPYLNNTVMKRINKTKHA